jgi:Zn-dependent M28 family amino/carboxypeptidase
MAAAAGAIGLIELEVPGVRATRPTRLQTKTPRIDLAPNQGAEADRRVDIEIAVTKPIAVQLFEGSGYALDKVTALAGKGGKLPAMPLRAKLAIDAQSNWEDFTSPQVIGMLPGSDPRLSAEHIVLMGHLDHIGVVVDAKPGQDRINNGALDNASGIATMLEAARQFTLSRKPPRRSLMFVANTGEEKGLLGAAYFAQNPTVPLNAIVGLVNLDMPLLLYDFTDVIAFGAEHSTIASIASSAAKSMNVKIAPDPMPQEGLFVRSDHYRFVARGVPSIFLMTGHANGGEAAWKAFLSTHYHKPGDELSQPINWNAAARFADLNYRIARTLADADRRPMWYQGSYFGNRFAPSQPKATR